MRSGFDNALYLKTQREHIIQRIERFGNKLYLEFGGKLFDDFHASRVLPGFEADSKARLLQNFSDIAELVFCINASAIAENKIRADYGITYDQDLLRTIDTCREFGLLVNSVVITQYAGQPGAQALINLLSQRGIKTYKHYPITGYPNDIDLIVSEKGYGANEYIETTRPLVVVTAPGPNSGKLATCLSQLYHESRLGIKAGYAKFETFPIWNLPLKHPVNLAYEAATADLKDVNMIDPYHLEAYGKTTVNYNRDIEGFAIVNTILTRIMNDTIYRSPTDMGVNMAGFCIKDDALVREAATQEIVRRYYHAWSDCRLGRANADVAHRIEVLLQQLGVNPEEQREVVKPAIAKSKQYSCPAIALQLPNGKIVTGRQNLMDAASGAIINGIKELAGIADDVHLMSRVVLEPIIRTKQQLLGSHSLILNLEEVLIALSICAATNPTAELALSKLSYLRGCEAHSSCILSDQSASLLRRLGIHCTCEPVFESNDLFNN